MLDSINKYGGGNLMVYYVNNGVRKVLCQLRNKETGSLYGWDMPSDILKKEDFTLVYSSDGKVPEISLDMTPNSGGIIVITMTNISESDIYIYNVKLGDYHFDIAFTGYYYDPHEISKKLGIFAFAFITANSGENNFWYI